MKPAKKKPVKESNKSKSHALAPPKKKATSKKRTVQAAGKPGTAKEKLSETSAFKKIKTENLRLTDQLEQKKRQLEIEAALESVRARTMAMQKSEELEDVANILFKQVQSLGIPAWSCGFNVWETGDKVCTGWMSSEGMLQPPFKIPLTEGPTFIRFLESKKKGEAFYVEEVGGKALADHYTYMLSLPDFAAIVEKHIKAGYPLPSSQINHVANFKHGNLIFITSVPVPEAHQVFKRFAIVFEQTYTRFLDLQKAEAQAREAQIEAALERVRARTMAMRESSELIETAELLFDQLSQLGAETQGVAFAICDKNRGLVQKWTSIGVFSVPYNYEAGEQRMYEAWENKIAIYEEVYEGERLRKYYELFMEIPEFRNGIQKFIDSGHPIPSWQKNHAVPFTYGYLLLITTKLFEEKQIFIRFAKVFEQTYTRFLDLQQAEAQVREAQIEAALERVRSSSLAMHHSNELQEVVATLFGRLVDLGLSFNGAIIWTFDREKRNIQIWVAANTIPQPVLVRLPYDEDFKDNPIVKEFWEAVEFGRDTVNRTYSGTVKDDYFAYTAKYNDETVMPENLRKLVLALDWTVSFAAEKNSLIGFDSWSGQQTSNEDFQILKRFARVFEQAYVRFLDLQKAEAQAREAQIEAALEKIRSRSMGMQKSDELREVIQVIYEQFVQLNIRIDGAGFAMDYMESDDFNFWLADPTTAFPYKVHIPYFDHPQFNRYKEAKEKGLDFYTSGLTPEERNRFFDHISKYIPIPQELKEAVYSAPGYETSHVVLKNVILYILNLSGLPFSDADNDTLMRFGKVFEQTYTRFNDLQKAEAQAREAQIEAALERVRSRTMAMQKSDELRDVVAVIFNQMQTIGFNLNLCNILLFDFATLEAEYWLSFNELQVLPESYHVPYFDHPFYQYQLNTWRNGNPFEEFELSGSLKKSWDNILLTQTDVSKLSGPFTEMMKSMDKLVVSSVAIKNGLVQVITPEPLIGEKISVLQRFAKVFEQTYTRFLDLQNAEAQAREAQIEAALEKVRSRSLAMHKSEELSDVIKVVSEQLQHLGFKFDNASFVLSSDAEDYDFWFSIPGQHQPHHIHVPYLDNPINNQAREARSKGLKFHADIVDPAASRAWHQHMFDHNQMDFLSAEAKAIVLKGGFARSVAITPNIMLVVGNYASRPYSEEENTIIRRFSIVFEQSYTRFLDLQKAEAQARQAQIELGLERLRAHAMSMTKSEELAEVIATVFTELTRLHFTLTRTMLWLFDEKTSSMEVWMANSEADKTPGHFPMSVIEHPFHKRIFNVWKERRPKWVYELKGEEKKQLDDYLFTKTIAANLPEEVKAGIRAPERIYNSFSFHNFGGLLADGLEELSEENLEILYRFSKEFDITYTRFLDLQKAEAQARESQIQLALERVRARTMAMQKSDELPETSLLLFQQVKELGMTAVQNSIGIINEKAGFVELSTTVHGHHLPRTLNVPIDDPYVMAKAVAAWKAKRQSLKMVFEGQELKNYNAHRNSFFETKVNFPEDQWIVNIVFFSKGWLSFSSTKNISDETVDLLKRFGAVFEQTYTRFNDLKQAEAQASEAVKRASVDRIRAEIASMRTTSDLQRITPLIWNELTTLGVPFTRCGVFIMDEVLEQVHTFLSTPEGKAIATLHVPFEFDLSIITNGVDHWRKKEIYNEHWDRDAFTRSWAKLSALNETSINSPQAEAPPENLYLHMIPFLQGMLYVGNVDPLTNEMIHLLESVAEAFSTAYARYEDFNKLESANVKIEKTLVDLKQTQAQLVQSEKMASLGELTAGIAHEIQNPLNFVNNFSEVNAELIDELEQEAGKGNLDEVKAIAKDIRENEHKIVHHGKRADAIVKGMLQHSRSSSGVKEPTDINALADEYLRLAYHGLRAKDKSFNAKFETSFDETIKKIEAVPQDLGRVILNLINNAFYAVTEKSSYAKASADKNYEPKVSVRTQRSENQILISVKDNGNGIPLKALDKIFQPFFTTKPTGQGTGLGLSLSYDIVKAHGGEIKVLTKENDGSEFIIQLPIV